MRYLIAIVLPPLALLSCGRIFQAMICLLLMITIIAWPVASIWALLVVSDFHDDRRASRMIRALRRHG